MILVVIVAQEAVGIAPHVVGRHPPVTVVNGDAAEIFLRARMTVENATMIGAITTAPGVLMIETVGLSKMTMTDTVIEKTARTEMTGKVRVWRS